MERIGESQLVGRRRTEGRADDEDRFRALYDDAYGAVLAYARRRVPADVAPDVAAETFVVAWRRISDVPPGDEARSWLFGVARRVVANQRRSLRRSRRLIARVASEPHRPAAPTGTDHLPVLAALARLRPADQEVLRLAAWEELTATEIGQVLGCSPNAASIRLHRARARLRKELGAAGHEEGDEPRSRS